MAAGPQVLDQLILPENEAGRARLEALMTLLREQTVSLEAVSAQLDRLAAL